METSTKILIGLVAIGGAAIGLALAAHSSGVGGAIYTNVYKGFTITTVCGGISAGCGASWKGSQPIPFTDQVVGLTTPAAALSAAQAKIDAYGPGVLP
jgi:hypothetical protein